MELNVEGRSGRPEKKWSNVIDTRTVYANDVGDRLMRRTKATDPERLGK